MALKRRTSLTSLAARRRRGAVLLLTLWIVAILGLLTVSLAYEMKIETSLTGDYRDQFRAEQLARLGVSRAVADLRNDNLIDGTAVENEDVPFDALGDIWAGQLGPRSLEIEFPGERDVYGTCELLVVDEESKLPLNTMSPAWRDLMCYMLQVLGVDEKDAQVQADILWDWKDPDREPIVPEGEDEEDYWAGEFDLEEIEIPNAPFTSVEELLDVPGITEELYYGFDPDKSPEPEFFPLQTNRRSRDRQPGLRDLVTVRTEAININTASRECLAAILGFAAADDNEGESLAERVISHRQGASEDRIENDSAFRDISELADAGVDSQVFSRLAQEVNLTIRSEHFSIYARGQLGEAEKRIHVSGSGRKRDRIRPRAHIVAECHRTIIVYPDDGLEDWEPPGYQTGESDSRGRRREGSSEGESRRSRSRRSRERDEGRDGYDEATYTEWFVPVVYFTRWVSY